MWSGNILLWAGGRGSSEDCDDRGKSPVDFLQNGARNNKRGSTKRGNAKIKKEDDDDKVDPASGSKDESRRTAYKRALQKQAESIRTRRRSGTPGKESRPTASTSKGTAGGKIKVKKEKDEFEEKRAPRVIFAPHGDQVHNISRFLSNSNSELKLEHCLTLIIFWFKFLGWNVHSILRQ